MSVQRRMALLLALIICLFPFDAVCSPTVSSEGSDQAFGSPDFTLPTGLTAIGANAFEGAAMKTVYISDGCRLIDDYAFKDCIQLTKIRIPAYCTIGEHAFDGCSNITIFGTNNSPAYIFCSEHSQSGFVFVDENQPELSDIGGGSAEVGPANPDNPTNPDNPAVAPVNPDNPAVAPAEQPPAGAVKAEVDAANSTVSVPNGVLLTKAVSSKYTADSTAMRFVYAMNEDAATHTSPEIINDILGLDGTGASFQTVAFMLIDAKTFELIPAGKITVTIPGNQLTQGLTSEQMKCFCVGQNTQIGYEEAVTANPNGTLTITLNNQGPFAICKMG